jgi:hypothetical protein
MVAFVDDRQGATVQMLCQDIAAIVNTESTTLPIAVSSNRQVAEANGLPFPSVVLFSSWPETEYMPKQRVLDGKHMSNSKAVLVSLLIDCTQSCPGESINRLLIDCTQSCPGESINRLYSKLSW